MNDNIYGNGIKQSITYYGSLLLILYQNSAEFHKIMLRRAENQVRKRIHTIKNVEEVDKLCLDGIQIKTITPNIKKMLQTCTHLEYLTMNNCQLGSLENFPHLPQLITLQLCDNQLKGDDLNKLSHSPKLTFLTLENNRISQIPHIKLLTCLPELQILQIESNPITMITSYRNNIFEFLPRLHAVDFLDNQGNRLQQEDAQYLTLRQRSRVNFDDFDDLEQNDRNIETVHKVAEGNFLKKASQHNNRDNLRKEHHLQLKIPPDDIMRIRCSAQVDSDEQELKPVYRDFFNKMSQKQ